MNQIQYHYIIHKKPCIYKNKVQARSMASSSHRYLALLFLFAVSLKFCYCQNETLDVAGWGTAGVTWYGEPLGAGSTGT